MTDTPSMDSGYWNARKRPALARASVAQWVTSSPSEADGPGGHLVAGWPIKVAARVDLPAPFGPIRAWTSPGADRQVHPLEDLGAVHGDVEVVDLRAGDVGAHCSKVYLFGQHLDEQRMTEKFLPGRRGPVRSRPVATPWTFSGKVAAIGGARRRGHPGRRVDLRHQRPDRRHRARGRPTACSSGTPGCSPASSCGSTVGRLESLAAINSTIPSAPPSSPGAHPAAGRADSTLMVFRSRYVGPGDARGPPDPQLRTEPTVVPGRGVRRCRFRRSLRGEGGPGRRGPRRRDHPDGRRTTASPSPTGAGRLSRGVQLRFTAMRTAGEDRVGRAARVASARQPGPAEARPLRSSEDHVASRSWCPARGQLVGLHGGRPGHRVRR